MTRDALRTAIAVRARSIAPWAFVPLAYLAAREALEVCTREDGLLTPEGTVSPGLVLIALVVTALRLLVLFVMPAAIVFRVVAPVRRSR